MDKGSIPMNKPLLVFAIISLVLVVGGSIVYGFDQGLSSMLGLSIIGMVVYGVTRLRKKQKESKQSASAI